MPELVRHRHLPRLSREWYQGWAFVHWTLAIRERKTGWLTPVFHSQLREIMLHAQRRYEFSCPTYCLMPDHCHLLWAGLTPKSDQIVAMEFFRKHLRLHLRPFDWQPQSFDHVLREKERERNAFRTTAIYILENPVRKGLVAEASDYPYSGALVAGYPDLGPFREDFWERFWKIDNLLRKE